MSIGDSLDRLRIAGRSIAVHRHNRARLGRYRLLDARRIDVEIGGSDVDENWLDSLHGEGVRGGHERIRRGDYLAGEVERFKRYRERDGTVGDEGNVWRVKERRQRRLEPSVEWTGVGQNAAAPNLF